MSRSCSTAPAGRCSRKWETTSSHSARRRLYIPSASRLEVLESQTTIAGAGVPSGTSRYSSDRQSSTKAWSARPKRLENWSSRPEATPTNSFSDRLKVWARCSLAAGSSPSTSGQARAPERARNRAKAAWRLAELDSPAPIGTSPARAASKPEVSGPWASRRAQVTPRT